MSVDPIAAAPVAAAVPQPAATSGRLFEFHMADLNPLQYLPIVGTIYRAITGEHIDPAWRLGGAIITGALIAGPVGIVTSLLGIGLEELFHRVVGDAAPADTAPDAAVRKQAVAAYAASTAMVSSCTTMESSCWDTAQPGGSG
jgi:hypothetical protein